MRKVTLKQPIQIDDKKVEVIHLDLEKLTGADVLEVENELRSQNVQFNIYSQATHSAIAAKAANIIPDDLKKLSFADFLEVNGHVQLFLLGQESPQEEISETSL